MTPIPQHSLSTITIEFLSHKEKANRRPEYLKTLRSYMNRFISGRESDPVSSVTPEVVEDWFNRRNEAPSGQCSAIGRLSSFFSFCERKRYIESNPMRRIERPYVERKPPTILSPDEATNLLTATYVCKRDMLGFIALGLFCGIRPFELMNMTWNDVSIEPMDIKDLKGFGLANVSAAASKVRRRRIVPIHPTALAWLNLCDIKKEDEIVRHTRTQWITKGLAEKSGIAWSHDILRHTAASYLLAQYEDCGRVAHWLGNSPNILLNHYYQLVQPSDCAAFWSITP